jgi:hypothetical protein
MSLFAKIPSRHMPDHETPILFKLNDRNDPVTGSTTATAMNDDGYWWNTPDDAASFHTDEVEWWIYLSDVTKLIRVEV